MKIKTDKIRAYGERHVDLSIAKDLTLVDRYDKPYELYKIMGRKIWIPRNLCVSDDVYFDKGEPIEVEANFVPRNADQANVCANAHKYLSEGTSFIINAPTGYGKTYIGAELISFLQVKTLIITTKEDIAEQWIAALRDVCGLDDPTTVAFWRGNDVPYPATKVAVALVQSVSKGPDRYPIEHFQGYGLTIVDEVHRISAHHFSQSMWWVNSALRVGLSATPYRTDGRDDVFLGHIGEVLIEAKQDVMKPKVIAQPTNWKVPIVNWYGRRQKVPHTRDRTISAEKYMYQDQDRNQLITNFCLSALRKERNTIVLSSGLEHLKALYQQFVGAGIAESRIGFYVGITNYKGNKKQKKQQREAAKVKPIILGTYSMVSEGTDIPWLDCCVLATPKYNVVQIVGRVRREWENKKQPVVFDLIDSDSPVFLEAWNKRKRWYNEIGAPITVK